MSHYCGNPLHDVPMWLLMGAPFLAPIYLWLRTKWRARSSFDCGGDGNVRRPSQTGP